MDGQPLYHGANSWGAVQHLACANELQKLGYGIGDIGPDGTFEIVSPTYKRDSSRGSRRLQVSRVRWQGHSAHVAPHRRDLTDAARSTNLEAAGFLGMSPEVLQDTYGHHHPEHLHGAAAAIG
jgi:hypothetical protein